MNKQEIYDYIKSLDIWYEISEHKAIYNMEEASQITLPYPKQEAKNLFIRDDKKRNYYLITVKGDKRINLKTFREDYHTRALSFASDQDLMHYLKLSAGSLTPFGLLNNPESNIIFYLDEDFLEEPSIIGVHPNDNTATIWLKTKDLIQILKEYGIVVMFCALHEG